MSTQYDDFVEAVNDELEACGEGPLTDADHSTIAPCFEYGHDTIKTVRNVVYGRKFSKQQK